MSCDKPKSQLLQGEARRLGRHKTKKAAGPPSRQQFIQRRRQLELIDLFGAVPYEPDYDYKSERRRQRR